MDIRGRIGKTYVIQQLHCHLDVRRLTCDHNQSLALAARRKGRPIDASPDSARFHDLYLTRTHMTDLVDLRTSFTDDASNEVIRDIDLLGLELLWRIVMVVPSAGASAIRR